MTADRAVAVVVPRSVAAIGASGGTLLVLTGRTEAALGVSAVGGTAVAAGMSDSRRRTHRLRKNEERWQSACPIACQQSHQRWPRGREWEQPSSIASLRPHGLSWCAQL